MQTVYAEVYGCTLACLDNLFLHLLFHLSNNLLYACGVDTSVGDKLVQSKTGNLAANRVEGGEGDTLRRVVNNNLYAGCCLKRADITSFATDDTTFDLIVFDMEDGYRVFNCRLGCDALYRLNNKLLCLFVRRHAGILHHVVDIRHGVGLCLVFKRLNELLFRLLGRHA